MNDSTITIARSDDQYRYRITQLAEGTHNAGPCQVCTQPADIAFHQIEESRYRKPCGRDGWKHEESRDMTGHQSCVAGHRRFTTSGREFRTGQRVAHVDGLNHFILRIGTILTLDVALVREEPRRRFGHAPIEKWVALQDLRAA